MQPTGAGRDTRRHQVDDERRRTDRIAVERPSGGIPSEIAR
jgi:hypothetical protein